MFTGMSSRLLTVGQTGISSRPLTVWRTGTSNQLLTVGQTGISTVGRTGTSNQLLTVGQSDMSSRLPTVNSTNEYVISVYKRASLSSQLLTVEQPGMTSQLFTVGQTNISDRLLIVRPEAESHRPVILEKPECCGLVLCARGGAGKIPRHSEITVESGYPSCVCAYRTY